MIKPTQRDWERLVRLGHYLLVKSLVVQLITNQDRREEVFKVWTDTDCAGCRASRKNTSERVVQWGSNVLKAWRSSQVLVALSSGEAEYYGLVKVCSVGI